MFNRLFCSARKLLKNTMASSSSSESELCSFGVIADVQYADIDDGTNYLQTTKRYYRNALKCLQRAVETWNQGKVTISFALQLGDIIDGQCKTKQRDHSRDALSAVLTECTKLKCQMYHLYGNHEFYNFTKKELMTTELYSPNLSNVETVEKGRTAYYHFSPAVGLRIVCLDTYDVSMLGNEESSQQYKMAEEMIRRHNPNSEMNSYSGLSEDDMRYVKFNGGIGEEQMKWLEDTLSTSDKDREIVIIASK